MPLKTAMPIDLRAAGARAGRDHERDHAEDEGERRHDNGPEPEPRRLGRRMRECPRPRLAARARIRQ